MKPEPSHGRWSWLQGLDVTRANEDALRRRRRHWIVLAVVVLLGLARWLHWWRFMMN